MKKFRKPLIEIIEISSKEVISTSGPAPEPIERALEGGWRSDEKY